MGERPHYGETQSSEEGMLGVVPSTVEGLLLTRCS